MPEIKIDVYKKIYQDGTLAVIIDCPEYRIFTSGVSFEEAFREFGIVVDASVMHYTLTPDEKLHSSTIEYKKKILKFMEIVEK